MYKFKPIIILFVSLLSIEASAQPEGWIIDENNYVEGWVFAGAESATEFTLPEDESTVLSFSEGCIPFYEPTCCAAWTDSNWVEFSGISRTADVDVNSLMFGGIHVFMENYDGEELMIGGILEDFIKPVSLTVSFDPSIIEDNYMIPQAYYVMYYNQWNGRWRETNLDYEFDYDNNTVTLEGYEVHTYLGFFARDFYNRPPSFLEVPEELNAVEGEVQWFEVTYTDPDDIYGAVIDIERGNFPGELTFYETEVGEGELVLRTHSGDEGEFTAKLLLSDEDGETVEQELRIVITADLFAEDASEELIPKEISLLANYPNPFNPATTLSFTLNRNTQATLDIFDVRGVKVVGLLNRELPAGVHRIAWDLQKYPNIAAGNYIAILTADGKQHQRMLQYIR